VSFTKQTFLSDIGQSAWADQHLLGACSSLTAEELNRDLRISHTGILATLRHIYDGERVWLDCLQTTADLGNLAPAARSRARSMPSGRNGPHSWDGFRRCLEALPEPALAVELNLQLPGGVERRLPRWKILRHVLEHSTMHRGQVMGMIRMLGHQPPPNSPMDFYLAGEPAVSA